MSNIRYATSTPMVTNPAPSSVPSNRLSQFNQAGQTAQSPLEQKMMEVALDLLGNIQHLPADEAYLRQMGVQPVFRSGREALQLIRANGIRVEFGDMGDSPAHAQWLAEQNLIMINQRYKGDASRANLYAISEAIYHEAGHAAYPDDLSSIQEELDSLGLNTLANRFHKAADPIYAQESAKSRLSADGVDLYSRLFFDPDPQKNALINRVVDKYGDLPLGSPKHEPVYTANPLPLVYRIAQRLAQKQTSKAESVSPLPAMAPPAPALPSGGQFARWA